jgi:cytochrome P450
LIFLAGTLTTAAALPRLVGLLLDSGQMPMLQRDPSRALRAVDEGLRYLAPVPATTRIARSTVSVGGMTVPAGTRVIVLTGNLTRDRALFPDPDRFNVERTHDPRAKHLWYGAGPHFCFGFPLAQRELTLVLETLASLPRPIRLVSRRSAWGATIPAYASFRIVADRGRA